MSVQLRTCKLCIAVYTVEIWENFGHLHGTVFAPRPTGYVGDGTNPLAKLHGFMHRRIYPTMEIWEISGYPSPWYRVCTKAMFISKGSYGCGEPKNVIALSVQQTHWPLRTCKLHGFMHRRIYPTMEIWEIWATHRHGTVFAPRQCLYQKEATGVGSLKM